MPAVSQSFSPRISITRHIHAYGLSAEGLPPVAQINHEGPSVTIEFRCDSCQKILHTGDEKAGTTANCPQCGKELVVPAPATTPDGANEATAPQSPLSDFVDSAKSPAEPELDEPGSIVCPMCGEINETTTHACLACGEPFDDILAASPGGLSTKFGDVWSRAWELWTANLGVNVAAAAIAGGVLLAISVIFGTILSVAFMAYMFKSGFPAGPPGGGGPPGAPGAGLPMFDPSFRRIMTIAGFFVNLIVSIITVYFLLALSCFALENVRRQRPHLGALVLPGSRAGAIIAAMVVYGVLLALGTLPSVVLNLISQQFMPTPATLQAQPAVAPQEMYSNMMVGMSIAMGGALLNWLVYGTIMAFFWPAPFLFADRDLGPIQSLIEAPRISRKFFKLSVLMVLVAIGMNFLGMMACYIGLLFTVPLAFLLLAVAYDRCRLVIKSETTTTLPKEANP